MIYKQSLHDRVVQCLDWNLDKAWYCWIKDEHLVKMDSHGKCYRCGRKMYSSEQLAAYTYVNGPKRYHTKAEQDAGSAPVTQPPERPKQ